MKNDLALLIQLSDNDISAFEEIYFEYHESLYRLAFRYLKSETAAEDAVQCVFLKLWEARNDLSIQTNLKNYLYTMVKNLVLNELRHNTVVVQSNYELLIQQQELDDSLQCGFEQKELRDSLFNAINALPQRKKDICILKLQGEFTNEDIANEMNISVSTVKSHYMEALKTLRIQMRKIFTVFI